VIPDGAKATIRLGTDLYEVAAGRQILTIPDA
jgi:hypothetical protein